MRWPLLALTLLAACATGNVTTAPHNQLVLCAEIADAVEESCPAMREGTIVYKTREDIESIYAQRQDLGKLSEEFTGSCLFARSAELPEVASSLLADSYGAATIPAIIIEVTPDLYGIYRTLSSLNLPDQALSTTLITVDVYSTAQSASETFTAISDLPAGSTMVSDLSAPFGIETISTRQELHVAGDLLVGGVQVRGEEGEYLCTRSQMVRIVEGLDSKG